jgi:hypothetical protein
MIVSTILLLVGQAAFLGAQNSNVDTLLQVRVAQFTGSQQNAKTGAETRPPQTWWKRAKPFAGISVDYAHYLGFADVAKGTLSTATYQGDDSALGYGVELGAQVDSWRLTTTYHRDKLDIRQHYSTPISGISDVGGELTNSFGTMTAGRRFGGPKFFVIPEYGFAIAYDELTLFEAIAAGKGIQFAPRKVHNWKNVFGAGAGMELPGQLEASVTSHLVTAYQPGDGERALITRLNFRHTF